MIRVVNKRTHRPTQNDIYIGRPTSLGNPFSHLPNTKAEYVVNSRDEAVDYYYQWLVKAYKNNTDVNVALNWIAEKAKQGDVNLVCWCAPQRCHGDVIKEFVEKV